MNDLAQKCNEVLFKADQYERLVELDKDLDWGAGSKAFFSSDVV